MTVKHKYNFCSYDVMYDYAEPPDPPMDLTVEQVGATWAMLSWMPPVEKEERVQISGYILSGPPQPTTYGANADNSDATAVQLNNSACIEIKCRSVHWVVFGNERRSNVTGLVPAVNYTLVISTLSHGDRLRSQPSSPGSLFMTKTHGEFTVIVVSGSLAHNLNA